jgi:hypothetical protein
MNVTINFLAVGLAALSSMIVGTIYYLPALFGNRLAALTGVDPNKPKRPVLTYVLTFVVSAITAYVLAYMISLTWASVGSAILLPALVTGFFLWLGFTAARMLVHDLFDGRDIRIFFITIGHELVTILVMALIIGLFGA